MKPIAAGDRRIANVHNAEFAPRYAEGEPGTSTLQLNPAQPGGGGFYIRRMAPGARSVPHRHGGADGFVMLEGEPIDKDGTVYRAVGVVWLAPGTEHTSHSPTGCLIAVRAEAGETEPSTE